jgi:hypothetical protein
MIWGESLQCRMVRVGVSQCPTGGWRKRQGTIVFYVCVCWVLYSTSSKSAFTLGNRDTIIIISTHYQFDIKMHSGHSGLISGAGKNCPAKIITTGWLITVIVTTNIDLDAETEAEGDGDHDEDAGHDHQDEGAGPWPLGVRYKENIQNSLVSNKSVSIL